MPGVRSRGGVLSRCDVDVCVLEDAVVLVTPGTGTNPEDEDAAALEGRVPSALRRARLRPVYCGMRGWIGSCGEAVLLASLIVEVLRMLLISCSTSQRAG